MMLGVFKKNINKTNASIIELSKNQQITFNVELVGTLKVICWFLLNSIILAFVLLIFFLKTPSIILPV
jgi:hypothetical protein